MCNIGIRRILQPHPEEEKRNAALHKLRLETYAKLTTPFSLLKVVQKTTRLLPLTGRGDIALADDRALCTRNAIESNPELNFGPVFSAAGPGAAP